MAVWWGSHPSPRYLNCSSSGSGSSRPSKLPHLQLQLPLRKTPRVLNSQQHNACGITIKKMHLPEPALTSTLPSLHDSTVLDCRVYHPLSLSSQQPRHAAIVAHPYAPLGGCYDDPIVGDVAAQLLRRGFVVGTFNFRGAGHSAGKTSWTAKPERDDYASMIGFLVYYIHHLDDSSPNNADPPTLLLAGYSYGAMITTQLPTLSSILASFERPSAMSTAGQIRTRAESLAHQQRELLHGSYRTSLRVGEGGSPRKSHESWRASMDEAEEKLRRGVRDFVAKTRHHEPDSSGSHTRPGSSGSHGRPDSSRSTAPEITLSPIPDFIPPRPAHLLISPLQGIITHLATMSRSPGDATAEAKLRQNPTLAVYGDGDVFVSASKLRSWKQRMEKVENSEFRGHEVQGAGHFWIEEGVLGKMMEQVTHFIMELIG